MIPSPKKKFENISDLASIKFIGTLFVNSLIILETVSFEKLVVAFDNGINISSLHPNVYG